MIKQISTIATMCAAVGFLAACADYSVSLNKNEVYRPPSLISGYVIPDNALKECVQNTVKENRVTSIDELDSLICPKGDIENLEGIGIFKGLKNLGLSGNRVSEIDELVGLKRLSQLDLSNNNIRDPRALGSILSLKRVDLRGNKNLVCDSRINAAEMLLPNHCN